MRRLRRVNKNTESGEFALQTEKCRGHEITHLVGKETPRMHVKFEAFPL